MAKTGSSKTWIIIPLLLIAAGAGIYYYFNRDKSKPPEFITAVITRGDLVQAVTATGDLQPVTTVEVSSQISGLIREVAVDYNSVVKKGDLLARIDPATYTSRLNQAEAQLANTRASYRLVKLNAERIRTLREQQLVAQQELDQVEAQMQQAEAQMQIQQATVENAKVDLSRCDLYSPIDGIVMDRIAQVGKTVAASLNAPTLFTLAADLTEMQILAAVAEGDIGSVKTDQGVTFTVDAYPNRTFRGRVTQIRNNPKNQNSVITYATVINVKNDDLDLKPGMTATVSIIISRREDALRLPNAALRVRIPEKLLPAAAVNEPRPATRDELRKLLIDAGLAANTRRLPSEARERVIALAAERKLILPERMLRVEGAEPDPVVVRTVYKLGGTADAPKVIPLTIKTGVSDGSITEIIDGLAEGDSVITSAFIPDAAPTTAGSATPANPFAGGGGPRR